MDPYKIAAARLLQCDVDDLLNFRWDDADQEYIVIAPSGQKHRYNREQLEQAMQPPLPIGPAAPPPAAPASDPPPAGKLPATPKVAPAQSHRPAKSRTPNPNP